MIARLAKGVLPANTQIHKDALLALHKSATVFVSYIAAKYVATNTIEFAMHLVLATHCIAFLLFLHCQADPMCSSSENAQASGKKTVMPPDVIAALKDAEFDGFLPRLEAELKSKRSEMRRKKRLFATSLCTAIWLR